MNVLGLDLGVTSIGGSHLTLPDNYTDWGKTGKINWLGSRIIPTDGDYLKKFESGAEVQTKAAFRTLKRGSRKLKQRYILRRTRLIKVFKILGWVSPDFPENFKEKTRSDEAFKFNVSNYFPFDQDSIDEATHLLGLPNKEGKVTCSEDWVIYYLRKKALSREISLSELARIIYMFNQRRGFKSGRKDLKDVSEESLEKKRVEILKIKGVVQQGEEKDKSGKLKFQVIADNSTTKEFVESWEELRYKKPEWEGKEFTFLITVKNGKQLKPKTPEEGDFDLLVTALDNKIEDSGKFVGEYFFDELAKDKNYKIRQQTVKRVRYQDELKAIWKKQSEFHPELNDKSKLLEISASLYPTQSKTEKDKLKEILANDVYHVIANDIIYFQRELKSQKSLVSGCQYEKIEILKNGEKVKMGVKAAPKSSPDFQEFRIWQTIHNIKIYEREQYADGKLKIDVDVTSSYLGNSEKGFETKEKLFELFDSLGEVDEKKVFKTINDLHFSALKNETHRISLFFKKDVPVKGNETKDFFRKAFKKADAEYEGNLILNDAKKLNSLWHIFYSISSSDAEKSQKGIKNALRNPINGFGLSEEALNSLVTIAEKPKQYASLSSKAINKLLPIMRCGKYWKWENIKEEYQAKISNLVINGWDEVDKDTGEVTGTEKPFSNNAQVQGLPTYMAAYVIYDRHSERANTEKYTSYEQIDVMKLVPNNSLGNPLVEQIIRETLFVVKEVWKQHGQPDEIHIEMGRDLKKNAEERQKITEANSNNLQERERIKRLLKELLNENFEEYIDETIVTSQFETKPNPESPLDVEKFKIWKSLAGTLQEDVANYFKEKDKKEKLPTISEIKKYALWLTQNCKSPYTGKTIPLSKLFTEAYEVEHIIPRSKMKNDANENLVICETAINPSPYKGNNLARNFIQLFSGQTLIIHGANYKIFTDGEYESHCKATFRGRKLQNLLATEVKEDFISRQINDTRYITRKISELLQPIAKKENGLVFTIGIITSDLKRNWGLLSVWKDLMKPRFERLETILNKKGDFIIPDQERPNEYHLHVPEDPEFDLKRIDHRHHALDALIIAATTREHIRYLNSLNAVDNSEELKNVKRALVKGKVRDFEKPWATFTEDAKESLSTIITSIKANNKVKSKPKNKYIKWELKEGKYSKQLIKQKPNNKWLAVRKSMFKEPQGIIQLKEIYNEKSIVKAFEIQMHRMKVQDTPAMKTASYIYDQEARETVKRIILEHDFDIENIKKHLKKYPLKDKNKKEYSSIKIGKFEEYAAKRVTLDKSFDLKKINKIPYAKEGKSPIAEILKNHFFEYEDKGQVELAFSGEGLGELNKKLKRPITKITITDGLASSKENFNGKLVEVDAGANVFFVMYENLETHEREEMYSLAAHKVVERLVAAKPIADIKKGFQTIILSPNELVYIPTKEEKLNPELIDFETKDLKKKQEIFRRVYKMVSCTDKECHFIPVFISKSILKKEELGSNEKSEKAWDGLVQYHPDSNGKLSRKDSGTIIKDHCIKLKVDRLGNISKA